jgi:poly-gamma-glutamate capsule biosynthesis protein CapA/YwtB (metallophosphatase superfamily)
VITLALAGDTMLGRKVAQALTRQPPARLVADEVAELTRAADLFVLNLECCISERGSPWPDPAKPFFFRAPPAAVELLAELGVDCVTLANNHALDYGEEALLDTFEHLRSAGIPWVGAGETLERAREQKVLTARGFRLSVLALSDHPAEFAAGPDQPGIAFADLRREVPAWVTDAVRGHDADAVLVAPHWGPNMAPAPVSHVRTAAKALTEAGAGLVAGHSAHVFQGVEDQVLYDLGDFLDDYAVDPHLRNDLGLLFVVALDAAGPVRLEAHPLKLDYCYTRLAEGEDAAWIRKRFRAACRALGTEVDEADGRLQIELRSDRSLRK